MSLHDVKAFDDKIKEDYALSLLYQGSMHNNERIIELASEHGYHFSAQDLEKYKEIQNSNNANISTKSLKEKAISFIEEFIFRLRMAFHRPPTEKNKIKLKLSALEKIFIMIAGFSKETLASCPESDQKKQAAIAGAILVPAFLSMASVYFILSPVITDKTALAIATFLWFIIILIVDRALVNTYRHKQPLSRKVLQIFLRIIMSLVMAVIISHPIVLSLFNNKINDEYIETKKAENNYYSICSFTDSETSCSSSKKISDKQNEINIYRNQQYKSEKSALDEANGEGSTQKRGCGPVCIEYQNDAKHNKDIATRLETQYKSLVETCEKEIPKKNNDCESLKNKIGKMKPDILDKTTILHNLIGIKSEKSSTGAFNYMAAIIFISLTLMFIIIDTIAIVLKILSPGVYDAKVDYFENKQINEHRLFHTNK